jgi:hypothetical protein
MPSRRRFLQIGIAGAALLAAGSLLYRRVPSSGSYRVLDERSAEPVAALAPVVLDGALPAAALREIVEAFDGIVAGLSPAIQSEIGDLLGLLCFAPTRIAFAGVWSSWREARAEEIAAFLARWRTSRFDLPRSGYQALTQLLQAAWYGNPASWGALGYAGPPKLS